MRKQLLSGDPDLMKRHFKKKLRDKRLDPIVRKAIKDGKPVSKKDVERIAGRYADRYLRFRGNAIARTEALQAVHAGNREGFDQLIDAGKVLPEQIEKTWHDSGDRRVRDSHEVLDGTKIPYNEPFVSPTGSRMMHPGDTSLGADAEDVTFCRCWQETRIIPIGAFRDGQTT